jgi:hypothetical protein
MLLINWPYAIDARQAHSLGLAFATKSVIAVRYWLGAGGVEWCSARN